MWLQKIFNNEDFLIYGIGISLSKLHMHYMLSMQMFLYLHTSVCMLVCNAMTIALILSCMCAWYHV